MATTNTIMSVAQDSHLVRLPLELKWQILGSISDLRSLACAALSCKTLYEAFKAKEADLPTEVLINCVGYNVLPEAILVHECDPPFLSFPVRDILYRRNTEPDTKLLQAQRYAKKFMRTVQLPTPTQVKWTMSNAMYIGDYHVTVVEPLMGEFLKTCGREPLTFPGLDLSDSLELCPPTQLEQERVLRALYRFELFRMLFGCYGSDNFDTAPYLLPIPDSLTFFHEFAPWEIVQVATIHDFLGRHAAAALGDIAEHDIEWAANAIDYYDTHTHTLWNGSMHHPAVQHLLSMGLEHILQIASCDSFKTRMRLLGDGQITPTENHQFLDVALQYADACYTDPNYTQPDLENEEGNDLFSTTSYHDDGDIGAEAIWNLGRAVDRLPLYDPKDWLDRRWGCVFWDWKRLQELGVLDRKWARAEEPEWGICSEVFMRSLHERNELWRRGARGYWAMEDESRLLWLRERKPSAASDTQNQDQDQDQDQDNNDNDNAASITITQTESETEKETQLDSNTDIKRRVWYRRWIKKLFKK